MTKTEVDKKKCSEVNPEDRIKIGDEDLQQQLFMKNAYKHNNHVP